LITRGAYEYVIEVDVVSFKFFLCTVPAKLTTTVKGDLLKFLNYNIQHCFIYRPSDSTVSVDAGINPRAVAALV
jgi:hypothetical protein